MSTLNGSIWSRCSIAPTYPSRSHFLCTLNEGRRGQVRINVAAHQEKEKNEKTGKREAGEDRKQSNNFKEAACCSSGVVQRAARRTNGLCEGSSRNNWDLGEGQRPFWPNRNEVEGRTTTLRRLLIGAIEACQQTIQFLSNTSYILANQSNDKIRIWPEFTDSWIPPSSMQFYCKILYRFGRNK